MNIALNKPLTVAQYLTRAAAHAGEQRTELINGQVVGMSPERVEHNEVKAALYMELRRAIANAALACHAVTDGMTVQIDDFTAYEPDAAVYCGPRLPRGSLVIPEPLIVAEVLSPASAHTDRSAKLVGYFKLPSVAHYLIIYPLAQSVEHHARNNDGAVIVKSMTSGDLLLDPPGLRIDVTALFA